jgi:hypothetical protein
LYTILFVDTWEGAFLIWGPGTAAALATLQDRPCRKSTDLSWDRDEPSTTATEEVSAPAAEESAPLPQAETVTPVAEATLPEASVVEGEYAAVEELIPYVLC